MQKRKFGNVKVRFQVKFIADTLCPFLTLLIQAHKSSHRATDSFETQHLRIAEFPECNS